MDMGYYRDAEQARQVLGEFWSELLEHPDVGAKLKETGLTALFRVSDPEFSMYIDEDGIRWDSEANAMDPVLTLTMSADTVHLFWLKKLNVAKALATRQVKTRGPVPKVMKLLPLLKPANKVYLEYCRKYDLPTEV